MLETAIVGGGLCGIVHLPSDEYVQTILRDIAAAWREFSLSANAVLLAKGAKPQSRGRHVDRVPGTSS